MKNLTYRLYKLPQTVFTAREIALILGENNPTLLKSKINYYVRKRELISLRRGIYAKDQDYHPYELANRIFTPSYISLETMLAQSGIIFQHYSQIFVVSYQTRELNIDGRTYVFKRIKPSILTNHQGIINKGCYSQATPERAFLDTLYLSKNYHFDHLDSINWDLVHKIALIYQSPALVAKLKDYAEHI